MFDHVFTFASIRSTKQAFGFYIVFLLLSLAVGGLLGFMLFLVFQTMTPFGISIRMFGAICASLISLALPLFIMREKKLFGNSIYVALSFVSGAIGLAFGAPFGLIFAAYLTTRKTETKE